MWYKFTAYNSETLYGWTRRPDIAERVLDWLNRHRDSNVYYMAELSDSDDEADGGERPLRDRTDLLVDDDTTHADLDEIA